MSLAWLIGLSMGVGCDTYNSSRDSQASLTQLPVLPPLAQNSREEPEPEFVFKMHDRIASQQCGATGEELADASAIKVTRHTGDVRHLREIERPAFRRFHVEAVVLIQDRAADAVPVEPAAKISLRQAIFRYDVMNNEVG